MTNKTDEKFFVVRVWNMSYKNEIQYSIIKDKSFTLTDATAIKYASELMEDNKDISFELQEVNLFGKETNAKDKELDEQQELQV